MHRPDYHNSIVNLMAGLELGLGGGPTLYAPLAALPMDAMRQRPVILMLIDGLGEALLQQFPDSHLARHRLGNLSSVFPSTTASAITTFSTGLAPQQHAITGWHMWLKELGSVATILPFIPRHGGRPYSADGWSPATIIGTPPLYQRLQAPSQIITPAWIADSPYSRARAGPARSIPYRTLEEFFTQVTAGAGQGEPGYTFAYWTELDAIAHDHGLHSPQVHDHFLTLDRAFAACLAALRGSGALLIVTADHGLIDTVPERIVRLEQHPHLAATLALPLCGEPRAAYCYLRPGQERTFLDYIEQALGHVCQPVASADLIAEGWFGHGTPHPRLHERVGDYVLLLKENYVLRDRLANEKPFRQTGVHGGTSDDEMRVPLILCQP